MEVAGFEFADRNEMLDDLDQRVTPFDEMLDSQWEELQRLAETAPNGDITALPAEVQLAFETPPTMPPEHQVSLDALIDYELLLAKPDFECDYFDAATRYMMSTTRNLLTTMR